jgi:Ca2+-binding EF-hand superfamily protein
MAKFDPKDESIISGDDLFEWICSVAPNLSDEDIEHLVEGADIDGDGQINYKAYLSLVCDKILKLDSKPLKVIITSTFHIIGYSW